MLMLGGTVSGYAQNKADIQFKQKTINLGKIDSSKNKSYAIKIAFTNVGRGPLVIYNVNTSCDCTSVESFPCDTIHPGSGGIIKVIYSPKGQLGEIQRSIFIESNAIKDVSIVRIKGNIK